MTLHYIVDGYNIIKSDPSGELARGSLERQRERLVGLIRERRPQGSPRNRVTVVFDGPADGGCAAGLPSVYHSGDVRIMFGEGRSADRRIVELVEDSPGEEESVVVTDDRGIRRLLGGTGARFMSGNAFRSRLQDGGRRGERPGDGPDPASLREIDEELRRRWLSQ